jgi:apolipoprotein N-acyltransferase
MPRAFLIYNRFTAFWQHQIGARAAAHPFWAAFISGLILPLAYPPFYLLPIFYLATCLVFFLAVQKTAAFSIWQLARLGWCFGFGQFASGMAWIGEAFLVEAELFLWALPFAVTGLPAGLGLFHAAAFALFGVLAKRLQPDHLGAYALLAVLVALSEYARGHVLTGLPWNLPLMGWAGWLYLAQPVALMGIYGLSLVALLSAALMASGRRPAVLAALAMPLAAFIFSAVILSTDDAPSGKTANAEAPEMTPKITIVQPNLAQREKWRADLRDRHIEKTFKMTALGLQYAPDTDLIIWPETAIPALIDEGTGFAERLAAALPRNDKGHTAYLLTGAIRREVSADGTAFFNSAMLWSGDGLLLALSDKHHLVPFGEYLPLQSFLEAIGLQQLTRLRGGYAAGPKAARLSAARLPLLAPLICYEAVFPGLAHGGPRPAAFVNLTNDGWFGTSFGPYQHLAQARLRAIEQGIPLLRAANTGMSAAFDARGRQLERLPLAEAGVFSLPLPAALPPRFYSRYGDLLFWLICGGVLIFVWARRARGLESRLP